MPAVPVLLNLTRFGHRAAFFEEGCGFFSLTDSVCGTPLRRAHRRRKPDSNFWPLCRLGANRGIQNDRKRPVSDVVIVFKLDGAGTMSVVSGTQSAQTPGLAAGVRTPIKSTGELLKCTVAAQDRKQATDTSHSPGAGWPVPISKPDIYIIR